jgi:hypothetical protein
VGNWYWCSADVERIAAERWSRLANIDYDVFERAEDDISVLVWRVYENLGTSRLKDRIDKGVVDPVIPHST